MNGLRSTMPVALLLLLCLACNNNRRQPSSLNRDLAASQKVSDNTADFEEKADTAGPAGAVSGHQPAQSLTPIPAVDPDWDKKIIKTADLEMEVRNYRDFNERLRQRVKQFGGYIAREEQSQSVYKIENNIVIKVPVDQFDDAISRLVSDSIKLIGKKISAEDVTMQIVDTKSRMEAKRMARARYLDLLKQAKNMGDILEVQNQIDAIQEQVESAAGRIAYLGHEASFSTINLNFYQVLDAGALPDDHPSLLHRLANAFSNGLNTGGDLLVGIISCWPVWILVATGVWLLGKWRGRRQETTPKLKS